MAVRDKYDLLITYNLPDFWNFNQITDELYPKIRILLQNRISFYVIPKDWVNAKSGLIEVISEVFDLEVVGILQVKENANKEVTLGWICQITTPSSTLQNLLTLIQEKLNITSLRYLGDPDSNIRKIGIIVGNSLSTKLLKMAKRMEIDTIICTDFTFNVEKVAEELDINLIDTTLYIINLGLLKLTQTLRMEHFDVDFAFDNQKPSFKIF